MSLTLSGLAALSPRSDRACLVRPVPKLLSRQFPNLQVYELREASWFDRGTGHCKGVYDDSQDLALIIVEAEDVPSEKVAAEEGGPAEGPGGYLKEDLLLSTKVEKDDIYSRQQGELLRQRVTRC